MISIIHFIDLIFNIYTIMLFVRIFSSWIPEVSEYRVMRLVAFYTDPYLSIFRQVIPPFGMFDLSPIVAFLCLGFLKNILIKFVVVLI